MGKMKKYERRSPKGYIRDRRVSCSECTSRIKMLLYQMASASLCTSDTYLSITTLSPKLR